MWSDNETAEDLLGFKVHADLLIDVINDDKILPVTIGVFGDWGSGKSSILKIVYEELKGEGDELKNGTLVLYFNGWVFEGYDDAKAALLESIIKKFEENKRLLPKIKDETKRLLKSVNWMRVLGLGFKKIAIPAATAFFTGGVSLIPHLTEELKKIDPSKIAEKLQGEEAAEFLSSIIKQKGDEDESTLIREFRDDFKEMIDKSSIKKLVVIIDDLDRCTQERIIENLEAIKLFLNVERTAFIIGADPRIVRHAIEYRYKTDKIERADDPDSRNTRIVSDYLEKLIQVPYNLPKLSDNEVETFMTLLFCQKEVEKSYPDVLKAFHDFRSKNRYGVFGFADIDGLIKPEEKKKLGESITLIASLSPIITEGLNGNPRQIKRFLNTFTLRKRLVDVANISDFKIDILAKLMVLEYSNPNLFKELYHWQMTEKGEPKEIIELEDLAMNKDNETIKTKYPSWANSQLIRWLSVEPKLANIDLRDYYWIARDQLFSSISGSSLIPTHIRSLFKKLIDAGSGTILHSIVSTEVMILNPRDNEALLSLLEKELSKSPEKDHIHKIYIELMKQNVLNSINSYMGVIKRIDHDRVPFSLRQDFIFAQRTNPDIKNVTKQFRKESQIGKALIQTK